MSANWKSLDEQYLMPAYPRFNVAMSHGQACTLYDVEGNDYLDLFSGVGVNLLGYNHPALVKAINEQVSKILHLPFHFVNPLAVQHSKRLVENSIKGKVFYTTSGSEATEAAIKLTYKWKTQNLDPRNGIVVFKGSFHGRTLGSLQFTRQPKVYQDFPRHTFNAIEVERENLEHFVEVIEREKPIAVLMEPVLGSGGVYPISIDFLEKVEDICRQTNTLLLIDEIQSGLGRTGKFFAYQHSTIEPDLILFGKGAGGGTALGGIIAGEKLHNAFQPGDHGTTFAHPPISTALGLAVIETLLDDGLMEKGRETSFYFKHHLDSLGKKYPNYITEVRGVGMMFGISINDIPQNVALLQKDMMKDRMLIDVTQGTIVRLLPPLIITPDEIDRFMMVFEKHIQLRSEQNA